MKFESISDLKNRVMPALNKRVSDLKYLGYVDISIDDIWNDLSLNKWAFGFDLSLNEIVDDILKYFPENK